MTDESSSSSSFFSLINALPNAPCGDVPSSFAAEADAAFEDVIDLLFVVIGVGVGVACADDDGEPPSSFIIDAAPPPPPPALPPFALAFASICTCLAALTIFSSASDETLGRL